MMRTKNPAQAGLVVELAGIDHAVLILLRQELPFVGAASCAAQPVTFP